MGLAYFVVLILTSLDKRHIPLGFKAVFVFGLEINLRNSELWEVVRVKDLIVIGLQSAILLCDTWNCSLKLPKSHHT